MGQTWEQCCPLSKEAKEYSLINAAVKDRVLKQIKKEENKVLLGILEEQLPPRESKSSGQQSKTPQQTKQLLSLVQVR